jgi:hypothetical protein
MVFDKFCYKEGNYYDYLLIDGTVKIGDLDVTDKYFRYFVLGETITLPVVEP